MDKIYKIDPPLGYKLSDNSIMSPQEVRQYTADLVDDKKWKDHALNNPFEEVLECLVQNGHSITVEEFEDPCINHEWTIVCANCDEEDGEDVFECANCGEEDYRKHDASKYPTTSPYYHSNHPNHWVR